MNLGCLMSLNEGFGQHPDPRNSFLTVQPLCTILEMSAATSFTHLGGVSYASGPEVSPLQTVDIWLPAESSKAKSSGSLWIMYATKSH
jgi:hypothetical protein